MRLTKGEYFALSEALRDAYTSYDDLRSMVRRASDRRLQDFAAEDKLPTVITDLIEFAEAHDWVHELVAAARADNPDNVALLKVAAAMGLEPGGVAVDEVARDAALPAVSANLERLVDPAHGIADLGKWDGWGERQVPRWRRQLDGYASFEVAVDRLLADDALRTALGAAGKVYVDTHYRWPALIGRYRSFLESLA